MKLGFVKYSRRGSGKRSSAYLLRAPQRYNTSNSHASSVIPLSPTERAEINRLRYGWDRFASIPRGSKNCALPLLHLLGADSCTLSLDELVSRTLAWAYGG